IADAETLLATKSLSFAAIGRDYIESTRPRTGRTLRFIDKMPLNFFYAGLIHRALPRARIVCLRRNALDTCLSNYRQLFATTFSYYNYAYDLLDTGRYYQQFDALMRHWRETIPDAFLEVHYESVIEDTEREARRLLEFCGLTYRPEVLDFHENAAPVTTASSVQVRQPIYRTSVDRWRKYEAQLQPLIQLLGQ
ncbi:MAG: sulfotransferase, partial [Steroidobacteraceae bacterium]